LTMWLTEVLFLISEKYSYEVFFVFFTLSINEYKYSSFLYC
jgi:hypothetical protein